MAEDKHWKTVKSGTEMGDTDEACWASTSPIKNCVTKVVGGAMDYIMSNYDPKITEAVANALQTKDVVMHKNSANSKQLVMHKLKEGQKGLHWSLRQRG
jgi:hypothetical protein